MIERRSVFALLFSTLAAFLCLMLAANDAMAQAVTRGPYLQQTSDSQVIVRWRTDVAVDSEVRYGASPGALTSSAGSGALTTEHEVAVTDLDPDTRYYYSIGTSGAPLEGDDAGHHFTTAPTPGVAVPTRIWVVGDSGTADANARAVRDAYALATGGADTDLVLMLGDNAYPDGTDAQYQAAVFDTYPALLRTTPVWPTLGNHDGHTADSATQTGPYYDIFSLPKAGEAGGIPSGTEAYYSFDYGDIHFICLESYETDRSPAGAMMTWLEDDLAANDKTWVIAFWHHPPYTKGSHDSDTEGQLVDMRQYALPILEAWGVDLVLGGHSHSYERSMFLDGHYGVSSTLQPSMILDGSAGRDSDLGPYSKDVGSMNSGAVYAVAGSSGKISGGSLDHPAMYVSLNQLGSMILEVNGNRLDGTFLNSGGAMTDTFSIVKGADEVAPTLDKAEAPSATEVDATFSEAVDPATAELAGNYALDNGATVSSATVQADPKAVRLSTSPLTEGLGYTLTVSNIEDLAGNLIAPGASAGFTYLVQQTRSFQDGVAPDAAYGGTRDATLSQNAPTTNFGASSTILADGDDPGGTGYDLSALMAWDLSAIPADALVDDAHITLNVTNISSGPYRLFALLAPWVEGEATWNDRSAGVPWSAPGASGADRDGLALGSVSAGTAGLVTVTLNADGLAVVQGWIDGSLANNGLVLANGAVTDGLDLSSREGPDPLDRPKLTVAYTLPPSGDDTEAPQPPAGLEAVAVDQTSVSLAWTECAAPPCDNVGVTGYSIYRDGALAGSSATPDFTDAGLSPATSYLYEVTASDAAGNVSDPSAPLVVETPSAPVATVLVNDVAMSLRAVGRKKQSGMAAVTVHDGDAAPAAGATVNGSWSGLAPGAVSGVSDAAGVVSFESGRVDKSETGQFIFIVTDVVLAGHSYDPAANIETGDCIDSNGLQCSGDPGNFAPVAGISAPASCAVGASCAFTDASSDTDGAIVAWAWDFGDGETSTAQNPSHAYSCPAGVYGVSLTVTDDGGLTDTASASVTVTGDCPTGPVSLSTVSSVSNGGTWTATVRADLSSGAVVSGAWSGGVDAADECTASAGSCDLVSPAIRKREGSVTFMATHLDGAPLDPAVSITVAKP